MSKKIKLNTPANAAPVQVSRPGVSTRHPEYNNRLKEWKKVRDCMMGEAAIKAREETYLPRPAGMQDQYADAYNDYIERAHFPLICSYAMTGVLGVIITKMPEFNLPPDLEYLKDNATDDGRGLNQLFLDILVENFTTGRVPLVIDIDIDTGQFKFVQYDAEDLINWKPISNKSQKSIGMAVIKQNTYTGTTEFSHDTREEYRVMQLTDGVYTVQTYDDKSNLIKNEDGSDRLIPAHMGARMDVLPIVIAGSISVSPDVQPIPLIPVANCSIQIYRKEADLSNSEFISCNPTLCVTGVDPEGENVPNVVGSSVMITIPDPTARVFYTQTDTAALQHVKSHIEDLYEEAIRHGVAILDARKGVEAAEALRIRQSTQSASLYSIYLSSLNAIRKGLELMCKWGSHDVSKLSVDAPQALTFGIPDSNVMRELIEGFTSDIFPLEIVHKYLISSGLLDQKVSYDEYIKLLEENKRLKKLLGIDKKDNNVAPNNTTGTQHKDDSVDDSGKKDGLEGQQN